MDQHEKVPENKMVHGILKEQRQEDEEHVDQS